MAATALALYGDEDQEFSGNVVCGLDINGDGLDDLFLTAPRATPQIHREAGQVYVV